MVRRPKHCLDLCVHRHRLRHMPVASIAPAPVPFASNAAEAQAILAARIACGSAACMGVLREYVADSQTRLVALAAR